MARPLLWALAALLPLGVGCTVPMRPSPPEAERFAGPASTGVALEVLPLRMGTATAPPCAPAGEASCLGAFEIIHAAFLVKHPKKTFLIEAGISSAIASDVARFSLVDRAALGFDKLDDTRSALARMQRAGWAAPELVVITHAHWDHTSGLVDLERPRVVMAPGEAEFLRNFPADKPPTSMPHHAERAALESFSWDGPPYENFERSHDLFGDGSVVFVPMPGHTPGSMGVFLSSVRGRRVLFVGDTVWSTRGIAIPSHKLKPLSRLADLDTDELSGSIWRLHHLQRRDPGLLIIPTHDGRAVAELARVATTPLPPP